MKAAQPTDARRLGLWLLTALLLLAPLALFVGQVSLSPVRLADDPLRLAILLDLRLPRVLLGAVIGASLGLSGAVMQGLLRNPLADPGLFGVSATAALGAVLSLFFGATAAWVLPLSALAGAAAGMALLALLAGGAGSAVLFALAGMMLSSLASALTALAISLSPNPFATAQILDWLMGGLTDRSWPEAALGLPPMLAGMALLALTGQALDALTLGEDTARSLGIDMRRLHALAVAGIGLAIGGGVAVAGVIGFVGFVVPHLLRPLAGHRPSALLLPSALAGALLVVVADAITRLAPTATEPRLGILLALLGAPFFLWLLLAMRRQLP